MALWPCNLPLATYGIHTIYTGVCQLACDTHARTTLNHSSENDTWVQVKNNMAFPGTAVECWSVQQTQRSHILSILYLHTALLKYAPLMRPPSLSDKFVAVIFPCWWVLRAVIWNTCSHRGTSRECLWPNFGLARHTLKFVFFVILKAWLYDWKCLLLNWWAVDYTNTQSSE